MSDTTGYDADRERLWQATVETLTAAARLEHPKYGTIDFADFLTSALSATAANLGDTCTLTAGRSGSWESANLSALLDGALGQDPSMFELAEYRTEAVEVPLHVANLVFLNASGEGDPGTFEEFDDVLHRAGDDDAAKALLVRQYTAAYQSYADRFTAAVRAEAAKRPRLTELVTTAVDTNLTREAEPDIDNPVEGHCDPLVWHFWSTALQTVGMPTVPARTAEM